MINTLPFLYLKKIEMNCNDQLSYKDATVCRWCPHLQVTPFQDMASTRVDNVFSVVSATISNFGLSVTDVHLWENETAT